MPSGRTSRQAGLLPAELLGLTALCDDAALFYVRRSFEVAPGETLKPSWSLGVFVGLCGRGALS